MLLKDTLLQDTLLQDTLLQDTLLHATLLQGTLPSVHIEVSSANMEKQITHTCCAVTFCVIILTSLYSQLRARVINLPARQGYIGMALLSLTNEELRSMRCPSSLPTNYTNTGSPVSWYLVDQYALPFQLQRSPRIDLKILRTTIPNSTKMRSYCRLQLQNQPVSHKACRSDRYSSRCAKSIGHPDRSRLNNSDPISTLNPGTHHTAVRVYQTMPLVIFNIVPPTHYPPSCGLHKNLSLGVD
ncbi:hypothetical protein J6590_056329 [Homalodisca vitripennis]|nr:hypothetical protein J6590_056329 [Homalodisca vitripennis]